MRARIETPLKQHLEEHGTSQAWLAGKLGVQRQEVNAWANGIHVPAEATRRRIAEILARSEDHIVVNALHDELFPIDQAEAAA